MELDQEKQNQEAAERCRALAQRIVRELAPHSVQVLEDSGLLEKAFCKMNTAVVQSTPELLVVEDPQWVSLPAVQAEKVLLVCAEYAGMADCAKQLAAQGFCRELTWKDHGKEQLTALFCRMDAPELPELENGYEQQLDVLRERTLLAERTAAEQSAQLERLRSDLSLSRSHEPGLGKDPEQRGQLHLLEGQLAAAVSGKQGPSAVAHLPAVRLFCHPAPGGLCGRKGTGQGQKGV